MTYAPPTYTVWSDLGYKIITNDYSYKDIAIDCAKSLFKNGAIEVKVYHYTNNGANCVNDYVESKEHVS